MQPIKFHFHMVTETQPLQQISLLHIHANKVSKGQAAKKLNIPSMNYLSAQRGATSLDRPLLRGSFYQEEELLLIGLYQAEELVPLAIAKIGEE